jgi:SAM-dependent methyltransferase
MSGSHADFSGSIPATYDACLGPLLFEFSGADIAERVAGAIRRGRVLEIACGTGISTQYLRERLVSDVEIVATDLNPGMLDYARAHRGSLQGVRYEIADALALPFDDQSFDAVVCQFGIMFFPDIVKGLSEMARVLRPGGFIACNVWDSLEVNRVAGLAHETVARYFDSEPPTFLQVPFGSCPSDSTLELFRAQGFEKMQMHTVDATVECPSALNVARGLIEGNPGVLEIQARANATPATITGALCEELTRHFGPDPIQVPLREFVFTGYAAG